MRKSCEDMLQKQITLRPYQEELKAKIYHAWQHENALRCIAVLPTGGGKTRIKAALMRECNDYCVAIAHRQELVSQISMALAECGVYHRVIGSQALQSFVIASQIDELRHCYVKRDAPVMVAGVDTLLRRDIPSLDRVKLWDIDEGHHVTPENKWGKAIKRLPTGIRGVGFTATPLRGDGISLGLSYDKLVQGVSMRWLINNGYLSEYKIICPPVSIDRDKIKISETTGDFNVVSLREVTHESTIVGDMVTTYLRFASGKRGIVFCVDVEEARKTTEAFQAAGVRAELVTGTMNDPIRQSLIKRFRRGDLDLLVNVDLFGEGFDVPAVEVVIMGRATESYGLYCQQFGRAVRSLEGKPHGLVIDHVGNVVKHGLPDRERQWTLDSGVKKRVLEDSEKPIPLTSCLNCYQPYERIKRICPHCGHVRVASGGRGTPETVEGDLMMLDDETLRLLRGEINRIDGDPLIPFGASSVVEASVKKRWRERKAANAALRDAIAQWAGIRKYGEHRDDSEMYRLFYHVFGVDVLTAQTLSATEALKLKERVVNYDA